MATTESPSGGSDRVDGRVDGLADALAELLVAAVRMRQAAGTVVSVRGNDRGRPEPVSSALPESRRRSHQNRPRDAHGRPRVSAYASSSSRRTDRVAATDSFEGSRISDAGASAGGAASSATGMVPGGGRSVLAFRRVAAEQRVAPVPDRVPDVAAEQRREPLPLFD